MEPPNHGHVCTYISTRGESLVYYREVFHHSGTKLQHHVQYPLSEASVQLLSMLRGIHHEWPEGAMYVYTFRLARSLASAIQQGSQTKTSGNEVGQKRHNNARHGS